MLLLPHRSFGAHLLDNLKHVFHEIAFRNFKVAFNSINNFHAITNHLYTLFNCVHVFQWKPVHLENSLLIQPSTSEKECKP